MDINDVLRSHSHPAMVGGGNAQPADVLSGKTFTSNAGFKTGTMPNNGAINQTITTQNGQVAIAAGYHNGSGIVTANISNLIAANIKKDANVGGVIGTFAPSLAVLITQNLTGTTPSDSSTTTSISISSTYIVGQVWVIWSSNNYLIYNPSNTLFCDYYLEDYILIGSSGNKLRVSVSVTTSSVNLQLTGVDDANNPYWASSYNFDVKILGYQL